MVRRLESVCGSLGRQCAVSKCILRFAIHLYLFTRRNFRIFHDEKAQIGCSVFRLDRSVAQKGETETFPADGEASLFAWVEGVVQNALR